MRDLQGVRDIGFRALLIAEDSERDDRHLDRSVIGHELIDEHGMGGGVVGVEGHTVDVCGASSEDSGAFALQIVGAAGGEDDGAPGREAGRQGDPDLGASAKDHDCAGSVRHGDQYPTHAGAGRDRRYRGFMTRTAADLGDAALDFLTERHLGSLVTLRADGTPHVVAVGFTYDTDAGLARVITFDGSQKVRNVERGGYASLTHVDGPRWLTLEGPAVIRREPDRVADAERRYAARYREPKPNPRRVVIEVTVTRVLGSQTLLGAPTD